MRAGRVPALNTPDRVPGCGDRSGSATGTPSCSSAAASRPSSGVSGLTAPFSISPSSHGVCGIGRLHATASRPTSAARAGSPPRHSSAIKGDRSGAWKSASANSRFSPVSYRAHRSGPSTDSPRSAVATTRCGNRSRSGEYVRPSARSGCW